MPSEMTARQQSSVDRAPEMSKGVLAHAYLATCSPRAAIKAKCLDCCNFDREEVRNCAVEACPLHSFRPYLAKK